MQRVSAFLVVSLVSGVLAQVQPTVTTTSLISITPAPSVPASGLPQGLIGITYDTQLGGFTTWYCSPGSIFSTVGSYARCCTSDPFVECGVATACLSTSLLVGPGSLQIWTCSGTGYATSCITGTVYNSISGTDFVINIDCYSGWSGGNWTATKNVMTTSSSSPPTTTPSTMATTSLSPGTTPSSFPEITSTSSSTTSSPVTTSISSANPSSSQTSTTSTNSSPNLSTADIVIIVFIFVAIVVAITSFCIYRRRKKQRSSSTSHGRDSHDLETSIQQLNSTGTAGVAEADGVNSGAQGRRGTTTTTMSEIYTAPSAAQTRTEGPYQLDAAARSEGTIFHSIAEGDEDGEVAL